MPEFSNKRANDLLGGRSGSRYHNGGSRRSNNRRHRTRRNIRHEPFQRFLHALRLETKRTRTSFIRNLAVAIDHIQTIRPAGVVTLSRVLEIIDQCRKFDSQLHDAQLAQLRTLVDILRRRENYVVILVIGVLPDVGSVRFADVNRVELYLILIFLVESIEGGNLPPKRRSSVAAEHQHHGFLRTEGRELHRGFVIHSFEREVRSHLTDGVATASSDFPQRLERKNHERRPWNITHRARKTVRPREHQGKERRRHHGVRDNQSDQDFKKFLHVEIVRKRYNDAKRKSLVLSNYCDKSPLIGNYKQSSNHHFTKQMTGSV